MSKCSTKAFNPALADTYTANWETHLRHSQPYEGRPGAAPETHSSDQPADARAGYVGSKRSDVFHRSSCTSVGKISERTLRGAEAQLIRSLIGHVQYEQEEIEDEPWPYGVSLFDDLLLPQKLVLLANVGDALLRDDIPCPPLNAINEATLGALMRALLQALEFEIDTDQSRTDAFRTYWRELTFAAVRELDGDDGDLPDPSSCELDDWYTRVDVIDSFLLWDDDWATPEMVMDADPETARLIKERLTIDDDYYIAIAPDPTDAEVAAARATLHRIDPPA